MPTIILATDRDLRPISSQNSAALLEFPFLYIPTGDGEVMKSWGIARSDGDASVMFYERLYPGSLVAPKFMGERVDRGELLYYGAEPAADFA